MPICHQRLTTTSNILQKIINNYGPLSIKSSTYNYSIYSHNFTSQSSRSFVSNLGKITNSQLLAYSPCSQKNERPFGNPFLNKVIRWKTVSIQPYRVKGSRIKHNKKHIGIKVVCGEYVRPGQMLVKQRRQIAFNLHLTRRRHFKHYPGENVHVDRLTSLYSTAWGRVKYTHDVTRNCIIANVLPEVREDIQMYDLWRYRMEHVRSMEENRNICWLRTKAGTIFPKRVINPPRKPPPSKHKKRVPDMWENPAMPDSKLRLMGYPVWR